MTGRAGSTTRLRARAAVAFGWVAGLAIMLSACSDADDRTERQEVEPESSISSADGPTITTVQVLTPEVGRFERVDVTVEFDADYTNPFDQREVALDADFLAPDGSSWRQPGFYDGDGTWGFRFTPSVAGDWTAEITVRDRQGSSQPGTAGFTVSESDNKGWIVPGDRVDQDYSPRYLAHMDGTPWFGLGHADLEMTFGGFNGTQFAKMAEMPDAGENFEMWWPLWGNNFFQGSPEDYLSGPMSTIDLVLTEAERNDITLAYTVWNHQLLRTNNHRWGNGMWQSNGFRELVDIGDFFSDEESWAWQQNLYRYTIARWSYSPAIAMWQTVSEINGTESYEHTDEWHQRVNQYFLDNDPYRHPTSGTKSGGEFWPSANEVADVPQMHVYEQFNANPVAAAKIMADWTVKMWDDQAKPNWIGEYGDRTPRTYPEFFHNTIWATVAAGAAVGPIEWNDGSDYARFSEEMAGDQARLRAFLDTVPLVALNPEQLAIGTETADVRGWGVAGKDGGLIWIQDAAGQELGTGIEEDMDAIRARPPRTGVTVTVDGLGSGAYQAKPYDTWTGRWLEPIAISCAGSDDGSDGDGDGETCAIDLPTISHDLALRLDRR